MILLYILNIKHQGSLRRRCNLTLGPVVRRLISANPGLNFNLGFFFFCSKAFSRIIFTILFRASNHQIVGKNSKTEFAFKFSYLNSNFTLTLGYLNPALKNPALAWLVMSAKQQWYPCSGPPTDFTNYRNVFQVSLKPYWPVDNGIFNSPVLART